MPAVSDSSPLILLAAVGRLDLLHRIYGKVVVPPTVWREVVEAGSGRPGTADVPRLDWIRRQPLEGDGYPLLSWPAWIGVKRRRSHWS